MRKSASVCHYCKISLKKTVVNTIYFSNVWVSNQNWINQHEMNRLYATFIFYNKYILTNESILLLFIEIEHYAVKSSGKIPSREFFQAVSILLCSCTPWALMKCMEKKLEEDYKRILSAVLNKSIN